MTTLLHSKNVDLPVVNEEKRFEFFSCIPESNRKKEFVEVSNSEVKMGRQLISTPILSSSVRVFHFFALFIMPYNFRAWEFSNKLFSVCFFF